VRAAAADILGALKAKPAVHHLIAASADPDSEVAAEATCALLILREEIKSKKLRIAIDRAVEAQYKRLRKEAELEKRQRLKDRD